jgi:hypothetical protein
VKGSCARSQLTSGIRAEILDANITEVNLLESHCLTITRPLGGRIDGVHENAHPLLSGTVGIDRTARFSGSLNLNSLWIAIA